MTLFTSKLRTHSSKPLAQPNVVKSVTPPVLKTAYGTSGLSATVFWRIGTDPFSPTPMFDDGLHGDGLAGDGVFGAVLVPQAHLAVVDFYVRATDSGALFGGNQKPHAITGRQLAESEAGTQFTPYQ